MPIKKVTLYADKAYCDTAWKEELESKYSVVLRTPIKKQRNESNRSRDAYSSFVSAMRQPVESFFNWLNARTGIQSASKVRSLSGLLIHIFGRVAVALYGVLSNP